MRRNRRPIRPCRESLDRSPQLCAQASPTAFGQRPLHAQRHGDGDAVAGHDRRPRPGPDNAPGRGPQLTPDGRPAVERQRILGDDHRPGAVRSCPAGTDRPAQARTQRGALASSGEAWCRRGPGWSPSWHGDAVRDAQPALHDDGERDTDGEETGRVSRAPYRQHCENDPSPAERDRLAHRKSTG